MYYVYLLKFSDGKEYVGCTNNINQRRIQHNDKSFRKLNTPLGRYLIENNIYLNNEDFIILNEFVDRNKALRFERNIVIEKDSNGIFMLNDNYTSKCSRKGRNLYKTFKHYVVINIHDRLLEEVKDLRQYCINRGLNYKNIQSTSSRKSHITKEGYKSFHIEKWNALSDDEKEYYLSGSFIKDIELSNKEKVSKRSSKSYIVRTPTGELENVRNLDKYACEHGLNPGNLHNSYRKQKPTCGYQVIERI